MTKIASSEDPAEAAQRVLERLRRALEAARHGAGSVSRASCSTRATASPSATPGAMLNDSVTDGSWPMWLTDCGPDALAGRDHGRERHQLAARRLHVEHRQRRRILLVLRRDLHDHLVLVVGAKICEI